MKQNVFFLLLCYLTALLLCPISSSWAAIKINEIYPAPPSGEKEWVELFNDSDVQIGTSGYYLNDLAQNKIFLEGDIINPYGFIIGSSSSVLNNTGDTVFLKNNLNEILDIATYSGTFTSDKTYGRCPNGFADWYTLTIATKNLSNDSACPTPTLTPTQTPTSTITPSFTPTPEFTQTPSSTPGVENITLTPQTYNNIYISEALVYPDTGNNEWVEIYNNNDFSVNLESWYLDDLENAGSTPKKISIEIPAKSYKIVDLTSSMFNNDGDQIRLLDFDKNEKDSFEYGKGEKNKTWGRKDFSDNEFCQQVASKETNNNSCINPITNIQSPTPNKQTPSINEKLPTINLSIIAKDLSITNKQVYIPNNQYPITNNQYSNVLGASSTKKITPKKNKAAVNSLSFLSFSYSLLTIASILIKIKS